MTLSWFCLILLGKTFFFIRGNSDAGGAFGRKVPTVAVQANPNCPISGKGYLKVKETLLWLPFPALHKQ